MTTTAPYGTWSSPITAEMIADTTISLSSLLVDGSDIYWLEGRPREGGRVVLVRQGEAGPVDVLPEGYSARSRVHEYGGGAAIVSGGVAFFVNFEDQRIYRLDGDGQPELVTGGFHFYPPFDRISRVSLWQRAAGEPTN